MGAVSLKFRRFALGLVPAVALLGATSLPVHAALPPINNYQTITEYAASSYPDEIASGPDGKVWYTSQSGEALVQVDPATGAAVTSYSTTGFGYPCQPAALAIGPDRNFWVSCIGVLNKLIRITPAGEKTAFGPYWLYGQAPLFMAAGGDGNLWFPVGRYITKLNVTSGTVVKFLLPLAAGTARGIAWGPDGRIWFTAFGNRIGRMTTSGVLNLYTIPTANSTPNGLTVGQDGNLYFTESNANKIGRITTAGVITEFPIPTAGSGPTGITVGPDGNIWFAELSASKIASMTLTGPSTAVFTETATTTANGEPFGIAAGPDGNLWFTETFKDKIGKIGTRHTVLTLDRTAFGIGNLDYGAAPGPNYITHSILTNNGADTLIKFTPSLAGGSGASGSFALTGESCSAADIAAAGACSSDAGFTASSTAGDVTGRVDYLTDPGTAYQQKLSVGVSATVRATACSSVSLSQPVSPSYVGHFLPYMATAQCPNANPLYAFRLLSPAGVWSTKQGWSTSAAFPWATAGYAPGRYQVAVWVKDALSHTTTYDTFMQVSMTLLNPQCSAVNVAPDMASPQPSPTTVTFTAQPVGCVSALWQWWVRNIAGVWSIVPGHDFAHSNNQFAWNTTGLAAGTYQVGVWGKDPHSNRKYDAYAYVTYTLVVVSGTTRCQGANVSASPTSPQVVGTAIALTASATSCDNPQYRWWVRDPAAVWHLVKEYSTTNPYSWTPTLPGTYLVGVWARQTGSAAHYEAYSFITYTVTPLTSTNPCSGAYVSNFSVPPPPPGSSVNFEATAAGCDVPTYRFFVAAPGGPFVEKQAYSTTATFTWVTNGLPEGVYQIAVLVRRSGSTASYEGFGMMTQQLLIGGATCDNLWMFPTNGNTVNDQASQSPQPAGTQLTWHAEAPACAAQLQYYLQAPGGSYRIVQSWSAATTWAWNTAGLPRGTYHIKVVVRREGTTVPYETFAVSTYELI